MTLNLKKISGTETLVDDVLKTLLDGICLFSYFPKGEGEKERFAIGTLKKSYIPADHLLRWATIAREAASALALLDPSKLKYEEQEKEWKDSFILKLRQEYELNNQEVGPVSDPVETAVQKYFDLERRGWRAYRKASLVGLYEKQYI